MKKGILKKIIVILIILIIHLTPVVLGDFNPDDWKPGQLEDATELAEKGNLILGVIQVVGAIVSVIVLVIIGIKYVLGSVEEKAEYKKTMIPYIIGAVFLFGATFIVQVIYDWAISLNN